MLDPVVDEAKSNAQPQMSEANATLPPVRRHLADTRSSITQKFNVNGYEGYLTVGLFDDGRPGELFIKMAKQGSTLSGFADAVGILTSISLQYGVPLEGLAKKLQHMRFEPCGWTPNKDLPHAHSIVDYIFRWLELTFQEQNSTPEVDSLADADDSSPTQGS